MRASHWPVTNSDEALIYLYNDGGGASHRFTNCVANENRNKQKQDRQITYKRNIEARSPNQFCSGKAVSITYYVCVCVCVCVCGLKLSSMQRP